MSEKYREEIFIGFRNEIGIIDLRGIEEYIEEARVKTVYLICRKDLNPPVESYLYWRIRPYYNIEVIVTDNFKKIIHSLKEKHKGEQIKVIDLDNFGERVLRRKVW